MITFEEYANAKKIIRQYGVERMERAKLLTLLKTGSVIKRIHTLNMTKNFTAGKEYRVIRDSNFRHWPYLENDLGKLTAIYTLKNWEVIVI